MLESRNSEGEIQTVTDQGEESRIRRRDKLSSGGAQLSKTSARAVHTHHGRQLRKPRTVRFAEFVVLLGAGCAKLVWLGDQRHAAPLADGCLKTPVSWCLPGAGTPPAVRPTAVTAITARAPHIQENQRGVDCRWRGCLLPLHHSMFSSLRGINVQGKGSPAVSCTVPLRQPHSLAGPHIGFLLQVQARARLEPRVFVRISWRSVV